jgi:hypothetical protein
MIFQVLQNSGEKCTSHIVIVGFKRVFRKLNTLSTVKNSNIFHLLLKVHNYQADQRFLLSTGLLDISSS